MDLSKEEKEVLWLLEEAGIEDIAGMLNTFASVKLRVQTRQIVFQVFVEAINKLIENRLVEVTERYIYESESRVVKPADMPIMAEGSTFTWNQEENLWEWSWENDARRRMEIITTDKGIEEIDLLIQERLGKKRK